MFKKFKSLFLEEDEISTSSKEEISSPKGEIQNPQIEKKLSRPKTTAQHQKKFDDILMSALSKNNLEGFDYFEYKTSIASLSKMKMDETTRFQSAFALAQTMGATPKGLIKSAEFYIEVLQKENMKFEETITFQKEKQITNKISRIELINLEITKKEKEIIALNSHINKLKKELNSLNSGIETANDMILKTKESFELSYYRSVQRIQEDINKMKQFLK